MAEIKTRSGQAVRIFLHSKTGERRELEAEEIRAMMSAMRESAARIPAIFLKRADLAGLAMFLSVAANSALKRSDDAAKKRMLDRLAKTKDSSMLELQIDGKPAFFSCDIRTLRNLHMGIGTFISNPYCLTPEAVKGKTIADCGANIGAVCIPLAAMGAAKVYAFEPITETYEMLLENIKLNKELSGIIMPVNKAVGDVDATTTISYEKIGDFGASLNVGQGAAAGAKTQSVDVVSLDSFLGNEKIGIIKMDIEGYEEKALMGARKIIGRDKPLLVVAANHKPDDLERLPKAIQGIRSDYVVELKEFGEKDLYCH